MSERKKKTNEPQLIEDNELDEASGGLLPVVKPTALKIEPTSDQAESSSGLGGPTSQVTLTLQGDRLG